MKTMFQLKTKIKFLLCSMAMLMAFSLSPPTASSQTDTLTHDPVIVLDSSAHATVDSAFVQAMVDQIVKQAGAHEITVLGIHTTWTVFILSLLVLLEFLLRSIKGAPTITEFIGKLLVYSNEHFNRT